MPNTKLAWRCTDCGTLTRDIGDGDYKEGDSEPCVFCPNGTAIVEVLPSDYEECGECGFDHDYASEEAWEKHAEIADRV